MLHGQGQVFLGKIKHIENRGPGAPVFAVVDGTNHFHHGLTFVYRLLRTVLG